MPSLRFSGVLRCIAKLQNVLKAALEKGSQKDGLRTLWVAGALPIFFWVTVASTFYGASTPSAFSFVFYLPVLLAAYLFGISGGFVVGLLTAFCASLIGPGEVTDNRIWVSVGSYVLLGCVAGTLVQLGKGWVGFARRDSCELPYLYARTLSSLAKTLEVRDRSTQGHCERVAGNALVLGKALKLSEAQLELLYWSALLHDMGKIAVPEHILLKNARLSPEEHAQVKRHADYGADLLLSVSDTFAEVAAVVRSHHERFDGAGYPQGLKGSDIPLLSRIISVVDVFEALTSHRPYREPMKPVHALHHIRERAGSQFDPNIVAVFETCYREGRVDYAPEAAQLLSEPRVQHPSFQTVLS